MIDCFLLRVYAPAAQQAVFGLFVFINGYVAQLVRAQHS